MNSLFYTGCFLSMLGLGQAWWIFNSNEEQLEPQTDIEQSCLDAGNDASCAVYGCIQRRFPCLPHSFVIDHGENYCRRYQNHFDLFDAAGQDWITRSQACMSRTMADMYRLPSTTCHALNSEGWDRMSACYVREGFCSIAWDNREALWQVFQVHDLRHTIRMWREIVEIAIGCGEQQLGRFSIWALEKIAVFRDK
ncbi:uncharacterized protein LOC135472914 [Liolophura sinensis]|uniref:uncharacterized protein LOC135472914 n=1 Tax=Liolophura sinensis TaxID=3198878 RepID=UPI00315916D9